MILDMLMLFILLLFLAGCSIVPTFCAHEIITQGPSIVDGEPRMRTETRCLRINREADPETHTGKMAAIKRMEK